MIKFEDMQAQIWKPPQNIEQLTELKEKLQLLPFEIEKEKKEIKRCMGIFDMLEEFNYQFSTPELDMKW